MINYRIEKASIYGGCNFCEKGQLAKIGLKYPYKKVFVILGNQLEIRVCKECLKLFKKIKWLN